MNRIFLRPWFLTFFKSVFKYFLIACFLSFELATSYIDYSEIPNSELQGIQLISLRYYQYLELSFLVLNAPIYANNLSGLFLWGPVRITDVTRSSLLGIVVRDICSKFGSFRKPLGQGHMRLRDLEICQKLM